MSDASDRTIPCEGVEPQSWVLVVKSDGSFEVHTPLTRMFITGPPSRSVARWNRARTERGQVRKARRLQRMVERLNEREQRVADKERKARDLAVQATATKPEAVAGEPVEPPRFESQYDEPCENCDGVRCMHFVLRDWHGGSGIDACDGWCCPTCRPPAEAVGLVEPKPKGR